MGKCPKSADFLGSTSEGYKKGEKSWLGRVPIHDSHTLGNYPQLQVFKFFKTAVKLDVQIITKTTTNR